MGTWKNNSLADKAGMSGPVASWRQRMNGGLAVTSRPDKSHGAFKERSGTPLHPLA